MKIRKEKTEASASRLLVNIFLVFLLPLVCFFLGLFIYTSHSNSSQTRGRCETQMETFCNNLEDELKNVKIICGIWFPMIQDFRHFSIRRTV